MENNLNITTIIQARTGSTRLPGKVLLEACGKPLLELLIERVMRSMLKGTVIVATTNLPEDEPIRKLCSRLNVHSFSGHPTDLLERHYFAALEVNADVVLKIPSDCPLIDPEIIDRAISAFLKYRNQLDYISNLHPQTYPDGNDVEVFSFSSLHKAYKLASENYEREHTTPFIWNNPGIFKIGNIKWETGLNYSLSHRFVLDYPEDYDFIRKVYERLYPLKPEFSLSDILELIRSEVSMNQINRHLKGKSWYNTYKMELPFLHNLKEFEPNELISA